MGALWLHDLPEIGRRAGLDVIEVPGWRHRGRSTGGLDDLVGWVWHHTASGPSWDGARDADYIANGAPARPISQLYLDRSAVLWVCAAGACNHAGRGGPVGTWLPVDRANTMTGGTEMGNAGTGEPWPQVQLDASVALAAELSRWYGLSVDRHVGHKEYCGPFSTTPGRKIDPYGPWMGGGSWGPMQGSDPLGPWRALVTHRLAPIEPTPPQEADDMDGLVLYRDRRFTSVFLVGAGTPIEVSGALAKHYRARGVVDVVDVHERLLDQLLYHAGMTRGDLTPVSS